MKSHLKQSDMRVIEIREDRLHSLAENVEKMLRYAGKSMQCIEDLRGGEMMGERRDYEREYDRDRNVVVTLAKCTATAGEEDIISV